MSRNDDDRIADPLLLVSADGHAGLPYAQYREYLDPEFRSAIDEPALAEADRVYREFLLGYLKPSEEELDLIDVDDAIRGGGRDGGWDFDRRLAEMDREGVAAEVVQPGIQDSIPPFFMGVSEPAPPELRFAGARAHHRWLAERMADAGGRIVGVADPGPCLDLPAAIAELEWAAANGFRSVTVPQSVPDDGLPELYDEYYDPLWAACVDLGLVLSVHAGWRLQQGLLVEFGSRMMQLSQGFHREQFYESPEAELADVQATSPLLLSLPPRRVLWQLMLGGAFDRHPDLKLVLTEVRADWVPTVLGALETAFEGGELPTRRRPSEYWRDNCGVTPSGLHLCEVEMRHEIGIDNLMFGIDFPHFESTWPNTQDWIRASLGSIPEAEARAILGENAIRTYGLDRNVVEAAAARVGPDAASVLRPHADGEVQPELIEHFHKRAGFSRPADPVNMDELHEAVRQDRSQVVVG